MKILSNREQGDAYIMANLFVTLNKLQRKRVLHENVDKVLKITKEELKI